MIELANAMMRHLCRTNVQMPAALRWHMVLGVGLVLVLAACRPAALADQGEVPIVTAPARPQATDAGVVPLLSSVPPSSTSAAIAEATATATETPSLTLTPVPMREQPTSSIGDAVASPSPEVVTRARQDLALRLRVDVASIGLIEVEPVNWADASLGCAKPGMSYAQVITPGYRVVLEARGRRYEYHSGRGLLVLCEPQIRSPSATSTAVPTVGPPKAWPIPQLGIALTVPNGFRINVFHEGLSGPRFMAINSEGVLFVAERGANRIVALSDADRDGQADNQVIVVEGLIAPSSLSFHDGALYVGETTQITRLVLDEDLRVVDRSVVVPDLPSGGGHSTRTVTFGSDEQMYVAVGSSCNVCLESDARRAAISVYTPEGGAGQVYATGLRNAVGLAVNPWTGSLWATNNGRDWLGDDLPPETVYVIREGADYGWPRCHAGDVVDPEFGGPGACDGVEQPVVEMQAHSAPLGIAFYDDQQFPSPYRQNAYIAFHGSWNRTTPTGYKVVRVPVESDRAAGSVQDFVTGWLQPDGSAPGRPVGVTVGPDGDLYISDDRAGLVYRVGYEGSS